MESKIGKGGLKTFCLNRKLKKLESKRKRVIEEFIAFHPAQASRMDNIENSIHSDSFRKIDIKIEAIRRLLSKISKN